LDLLLIFVSQLTVIDPATLADDSPG